MNKNVFSELAAMMTAPPSQTVIAESFHLASVSDIDPVAISINEMSLGEKDLLKLGHIGRLNEGDIVLLSPYYDGPNSLTPSKYILWGVIE